MRLRNAAGFDGGVVVENYQAASQGAAARIIKGLIRIIIALVFFASIAYGVYYLFMAYRPMAVVVRPVTAISVDHTARIAEVLVQDNDQVKAGQPLLRLADEEINLAIAEATAALESSKKELAAAREDIRIRKFDMDSKHVDKLLSLQVDEEDDHTRYVDDSARYAKLKEECDFRKRDLDRIEELHKNKAIGLQELDAARSAHKSRADELDQLKVSLERSRERYQNSVKRRESWSQMVPSIDSQILLDAYQAKIAEAQAKLDTLSKSAQMLTIRSPCDGQVTRLTAISGQVASAGVPLLSIVGTGEPVIQAYIEEKHFTDYAPGGKVHIQTLDGREKFESQVTHVWPDVINIPAEYLPVTSTGPHFGRLVRFSAPAGTTLLAGERLLITGK